MKRTNRTQRKLVLNRESLRFIGGAASGPTMARCGAATRGDTDCPSEATSCATICGGLCPSGPIPDTLGLCPATL